jgi:hypothetical protein
MRGAWVMRNGDFHVPDSQGSSLENRVGRLETGMEFLRGEVHNVSKNLDTLSTSLSSQIGDLGKTLGASGKTNWVVVGTFITVALALIGAFWQVSKSPLETSIARNEVAIRDVKSDFREADRDLTKALAAIASGVVPRGEHERIWKDGDRRLESLEHEVREIRRDNMAFVLKRLEQLRAGQ